MEFKDDRTPEQHKTHTVIVLMTDGFMSGWGRARNGPSYAGWACRPDQLNEEERRIRARSEARRVRIVLGNYKPGPGPGHCHIYVARDN